MKKHYILLTVIEPDRSKDKFSTSKSRDEWDNLKSGLKSEAKKCAGLIELAETAWLIPRNIGLQFTAECISRVKNNDGVTYKVLFLDEPE